jgi:hypothetical protein
VRCELDHAEDGAVTVRIRAKYAGVGRAAPTKAMLLARALQDGLITLDEI